MLPIVFQLTNERSLNLNLKFLSVQKGIKLLLSVFQCEQEWLTPTLSIAKVYHNMYRAYDLNV